MMTCSFRTIDDSDSSMTDRQHDVRISFFLTELLQSGENLLALQFGGGWYTFDDARFGAPQAIWQLTVQTSGGPQVFCSGEGDVIGPSFVSAYYFPCYEDHDYTAWDDAALTAARRQGFRRMALCR